MSNEVGQEGSALSPAKWFQLPPPFLPSSPSPPPCAGAGPLTGFIVRSPIFNLVPCPPCTPLRQAGRGVHPLFAMPTCVGCVEAQLEVAQLRAAYMRCGRTLQGTFEHETEWCWIVGMGPGSCLGVGGGCALRSPGVGGGSACRFKKAEE